MSTATIARPTAATPSTPAIPALDLPEAAVSAPVHLGFKMQQSNVDFNHKDITAQAMNEFNPFSLSLDEKATFAGDYSAFLSGGAPMANPFAVDDALLDSPLGLESNLSTVSSSPFDFVAGSFGSPEFDLPSLFPTTTSNWGAPELVGTPASGAATPELIVSPQMMTLDAVSAPASVTATPVLADDEDYKPVKALPKRGAAKTKAKSVDSASAARKDKFTGTRNTLKPPIDMDAPTLPKSYVIPACTSRKLAPQAITSKLTGTKRSRSIEEDEAPEDLSPDILDAIVSKRYQNTVAARRSRARKAAFLSELQDKIVDLTNERDAFKARCEELEQLVNALRGSA